MLKYTNRYNIVLLNTERYKNGIMKNSRELHRRVLFALLMGIVTTGIISFTLISINIGYTEKFLSIWLKSWSIAYLVVIPAILIIGVQVQKAVDRILPLKNE